MSAIEDVAAIFGKPKFRSGDRVRSVRTDRSLGTVRAVVPMGNGFEYIVDWLGSRPRSQVTADLLVSRFTTQSPDFNPASARQDRLGDAA